MQRPIKHAYCTMDKVSNIALLGVIFLAGGAIFSYCGLPHIWLLCFFLWMTTSSIYFFLSNLKLPVGGKSVLITGCDTGFGHALALQLNTMGFQVFALCLMDGEGAAVLRRQGNRQMHVLQVDVTSLDQLQNARRKIEKLLDKRGLWGLVNNAGLATYGDVEWIPLSTYKKMAEVNLFAVIGVTQTFLPLIRKARGRIVNMVSLLGRMGVPMRSPYVVTKYAVEGFSDCLRHEMYQWGVHVSMIEPGNFIAGTKIFTLEGVEATAQEMWSSMSQDVKDLYGEKLFRERVNLMKSYCIKGNTDLTPVLQSFMAALTDRWPQIRYQPIDLYFKSRVFVATHFPDWVYDNLYVGCLS